MEAAGQVKEIIGGGVQGTADGGRRAVDGSSDERGEWDWKTSSPRIPLSGNKAWREKGRGVKDGPPLPMGERGETRTRTMEVRETKRESKETIHIPEPLL
mmetsp:Transcript_11356/g.20550  ORF Transcript_11356/g.20550 Transcript_11356/m.20550 type:complete len:100 (-) Transcript_11356:396-695(-)